MASRKYNIAIPPVDRSRTIKNVLSRLDEAKSAYDSARHELALHDAEMAEALRKIDGLLCDLRSELTR